MISGIGWVSELIEEAGGIDILCRSHRRKVREGTNCHRGGNHRRAPDIIIDSWCGKKFRPEKVTARPGLPGTRRSERRSSRN